MSELKLLLFLILFFFDFPVKGQVKTEINWPDFMAQHDVIWEDLPLQWNEGAFCGNGQLGMMIYVNMAENGIVFQLGRQDVTDHRKAPDKNPVNELNSYGVKKGKQLPDDLSWPLPDYKPSNIVNP